MIGNTTSDPAPERGAAHGVRRCAYALLVTTLLVQPFAVRPGEAAETVPGGGEKPQEVAPPPIPGWMRCRALQTAGFHDYPHNQEAYEAVVFFESTFELKLNRALTRHLAPESPHDAFLTFTYEDQVVEMACARLRGAGNSRGLSCSNSPPSEMLLLNLDTLRFTRTAIGGWTFSNADSSADPSTNAGANQSSAGDSIFVEYGQCDASP